VRGIKESNVVIILHDGMGGGATEEESDLLCMRERRRKCSSLFSAWLHANERGSVGVLPREK